MASPEDRAICYSAFALVFLENVPSHSRTLAEKVNDLFSIYFESVVINSYLRIGKGTLFYDAIKPTDADRFYSFYLKPDFYACLQKVIIQDTGRPPAEGVAWLAKQYLESSKLTLTPTKVFGKAIKKFNRQKSKTKRRSESR